MKWLFVEIKFQKYLWELLKQSHYVPICQEKKGKTTPWKTGKVKQAHWSGALIDLGIGKDRIESSMRSGEMKEKGA